MDELPWELLAAGVGAALLSLIAWLGDRRRMRRSDPDAAGIMPWIGVFFWALLAACALLGLAAKAWLVG